MSDEWNDVTFYSLKRFVELAANANPNIIELLYMPEDCILHCTPVMSRLLECRQVFISKQCHQSHIGYAEAQVKRARGRNKWVNNPQPKEAPKKEDFCWAGPLDRGDDMPLRPVPLPESGVQLSNCHCSSLEHCADVYRLYDYGPTAKGVFRNGLLVCESISIEDEDRCIGLLIYNKTAWERACKDHRHYWDWRNNRNDKRWLSQERGEMNYDAKNMMHTLRLLFSGKHILQTGQPLVRFEGTELAFLKEILAGQIDYDELIDMVEKEVAGMKTAREESTIPETVDQKRIDELVIELTAQWESTQNA